MFFFVEKLNSMYKNCITFYAVQKAENDGYSVPRNSNF